MSTSYRSDFTNFHSYQLWISALFSRSSLPFAFIPLMTKDFCLELELTIHFIVCFLSGSSGYYHFVWYLLFVWIHLSDIFQAKIFTYSAGCCFIQLTISLAVRMPFNFMRSHCGSVTLFLKQLEIFRKPLPMPVF